MNYQYDDNIFKINLDTGGEVSVNMGGEYFTFNGLNCDVELDFIDDDAKDLIFMIGEKYYTALSIIQFCQKEHDEAHAEYEENMAAENDMARELSSPYLTGRI